MRKLLQGLVTVMVLAAASNAFAAEPNAKGERSLDRAINGRVAGQPVACINPAKIYSTDVIDKTAIVYRMSDGQIYVNRPTLGAHNLDHDLVVYTIHSVEPLCRNDFVNLIDGKGSRWFAASVAMGPFVPYAPAKR